jgi:hypothetical protein
MRYGHRMSHSGRVIGKSFFDQKAYDFLASDYLQAVGPHSQLHTRTAQSPPNACTETDPELTFSEIVARTG